MEICPKNPNMHCPLYKSSQCSVTAEECILVKTYEITSGNKEKISEMQKKFEALTKASKKVFGQFGITLDV